MCKKICDTPQNESSGLVFGSHTVRVLFMCGTIVVVAVVLNFHPLTVVPPVVGSDAFIVVFRGILQKMIKMNIT